MQPFNFMGTKTPNFSGFFARTADAFNAADVVVTEAFFRTLQSMTKPFASMGKRTNVQIAPQQRTASPNNIVQKIFTAPATLLAEAAVKLGGLFNRKPAVKKPAPHARTRTTTTAPSEKKPTPHGEGQPTVREKQHTTEQNAQAFLVAKADADKVWAEARKDAAAINDATLKNTLHDIELIFHAGKEQRYGHQGQKLRTAIAKLIAYEASMTGWNDEKPKIFGMRVASRSAKILDMIKNSPIDRDDKVTLGYSLEQIGSVLERRQNESYQKHNYALSKPQADAAWARAAKDVDSAGCEILSRRFNGLGELLDGKLAWKNGSDGQFFREEITKNIAYDTCASEWPNQKPAHFAARMEKENQRLQKILTIAGINEDSKPAISGYIEEFYARAAAEQQKAYQKHWHAEGKPVADKNWQATAKDVATLGSPQLERIYNRFDQILNGENAWKNGGDGQRMRTLIAETVARNADGGELLRLNTDTYSGRMDRENVRMHEALLKTDLPEGTKEALSNCMDTLTTTLQREQIKLKEAAEKAAKTAHNDFDRYASSRGNNARTASYGSLSANRTEPTSDPVTAQRVNRRPGVRAGAACTR